MLLIAHTVAGATLGSLTRDPISAFFLGFVSHIVLDSIPHWNYLVPREKFRFRSFINFWPDAIGPIAILITFIVADAEHWIGILAGVSGALCPDLFTLTRYHATAAHIFRPFQRLHDGIQREIHVIPGIAIQVLFIGLALFIYLSVK